MIFIFLLTADVDSLCQFCGTDTTSPDFVAAEHRDGVCNRGTIACPMCAKTFTQFAQYEAHKKTHQKLKQRQYPCQTCGKIFTSASNRNMHQRIHKGVRPFQCTPCGVFFRQKAHLQKHQRTQGHVQATEIYEKKRREGLIPENVAPPPAVTTLPPPTSDDQESISSERHPADSTQSASPPAADSSTDDKTPTSSSGGRSRSKSSPKRKQSRPQKNKEAGEEEEGSEEEVDGEEEKVLTFVEYNDVTHGYDCRQCLFSSHDLSVLKHHAREDHLRGREGFVRCEECGIAFLKEFYLRIHGLSHRTASQVLPCENCEQVFKAPNRLMRHMESAHSICSDCGERAENNISLVRHQEITHGEKKGFHASLLQFTSLNQLSSPKSIVAAAAAEENRAAKKRKLDSLAEVIRQKQLQHQNSSTAAAASATSITGQSTSALNGNEVKSPLTSPTTPRRRKTDLAAVRALLAMSKGSSSSLEPAPSMHHGSTDPASFMNQFDPSKLAPVGMQDLLRKSENNNILSSLKLPPAVRLPTQPVHGLTPPSSPPPAQLPCAPQPPSLLLQHQHPLPPQSVPATTASNGGRYHSDNESDDQDQETGLDLSMGGRRLRRDSGDENGVSSTNNGPTDLSLAGRGPDSSTLMAARALASLPAPPPPPHLQQQAPAAFPTPFPFLLPPVPPGTDPVLTEQLLKLSAGLTRPASTGGHSPIPPHLTELTKNSPVASASNPYTVLSAMLGQPPYHQPVFPGMAPAGVFPSATSSPKCDSLDAAKENLPKLIGKRHYLIY